MFEMKQQNHDNLIILFENTIQMSCLSTTGTRFSLAKFCVPPLMQQNRNFKLRLREHFFACDGDTIFKLSQRWHSLVAKLGDKVHDFVAENSTHWISHDFFLRYFQPCEGGYTCDYCPTLAMWQFQKIASPPQAKNCSCSLGFMCDNIFNCSNPSNNCRNQAELGSVICTLTPTFRIFTANHPVYTRTAKQGLKQGVL